MAIVKVIWIFMVRRCMLIYWALFIHELVKSCHFKCRCLKTSRKIYSYWKRRNYKWNKNFTSVSTAATSLPW